MERTVSIPDGVNVEIADDTIAVKGPKGELRRPFVNPLIEKEVKGNAISFRTERERRKTLSVLGTWEACARNMIDGVVYGYEAKLKIVYSHFPMKISVENDRIVVQNFLGEKEIKRSKIVGGCKVEVRKDEVIITGISKEDVGHTVTNLERTTRVMGYDRRIFQDGCFMTQKAVAVGKK